MTKSEQQLKVLFVASWYPNREEPQNGNFIQRHAEAVSQNCKVACLHVLSVENAQGFEIDAQWHKGVYEVIVYFGKTPAYRPFRKINRYLKAHRLGFEKIEETFGKIDLVHLNVFFPAGLFALWLKKNRKLPFVITEHWTAFLAINPYTFNWFEQFYIKKIGAKASRICPVSEDLKMAIQNFGISGPFEVIPNVVDTQLFKVEQVKEPLPIKILHVSTLNDQHKNISGFLRVIRKLQDHPIEEIAQLMQEYQIFVLFSNYENLPCVISEAHASGMVVIATDVGGVREMIDPQNGILIKAKAEDTLLEKLNLVMDNLSTYKASEIRTAAVKRYSYQSVADAYLRVYQSVLSED